MCGIIAYKGGRNGNKVVVDGLKSLEYRGYDSWGIAYEDRDKISVQKQVGKISEAKIEGESKICLGHTRWATTGSVTEANAHPHLSMDGGIVVVHNGIVENFQDIKKRLIEEGYQFFSETDTEVIPNLIQHRMDQGDDFEKAFLYAVRHLEGCYAVVAMHKGEDRLLVARNGSPLVIGIGDGEIFAASDIPAFLEYTNKAVYLDDFQHAVINNELRVYDTETGNEIDYETHEIEWGIEQAQKGAYPHFMLKEINEQKETIVRAIEQDPEVISRVSDMLRDAEEIYFVGCGTSYHACVSASYMFSKVAGKHACVILASEFENYKDFLNKNSVMVAVSQSGETADLLDAVKVAKKKDVKVLSVVNVMGSSLMRLSDETVLMNAGPEICVLSTKSYTSQIAILLQLAYAVYGEPEAGRKMIYRAAEAVPELINSNLDKLNDLAASLKDAHSMFLIGRCLAFPSALEGALKIKEVSYIHAEGFAGGELKHGTIALIEEGTPTIVLSTDATRQLIVSNAAEIKARGGYLIGIDSKQNEVYDYWISVPDVYDANPILMIIPIQILSYYLALQRGCDPDKPRNLAKSVTVK